ncbi:MAG TPA: phosphatidate cytidylyltransferase [Steroidobacteraceae bacterium]
MIEDILPVTLAGFALGAVVMAFGSRSVGPDAARARWLKLAVFFVIVHVVLAAAVLGRPWVLAVLALILTASTHELIRAWQRMPRPRAAVIWPLFVLAAASAFWNATRLPPADFAFLFLATAAGDGFAQVVGQWLGRRPLAPRVSPAKTVEGFLGGLCAAGSVAALASGLIGRAPLLAAATGVLTGFAGLAGDLAASWVKRRAGIKDYSGALPGQGGFLDRFDSLLGALALAAWVL